MLEFKYVSDKHIISKICREVYAFKSQTFERLWAEINANNRLIKCYYGINAQ